MKNYLKFLLVFLIFPCFSYDAIQENLDEINGELSLMPNDDELIFRRASLYYFAGKYDQALEDLNKCIKLQPRDELYLFFRAKTNKAMGRIRSAIDDFTRVVQINENHKESYFFLGMLHHIVNEDYAARKNFDRAIELCPTESRYYLGRARSKKEIGEIDDALKDYERALKIDPNFALVHYEIAWINFDKQNYDIAIEQAEKILQSGEKSAFYFDTLACIYSVKNIERAIEFEKKAIKSNKEDNTDYEDKLMYFKQGMNFDQYRKMKELIKEEKIRQEKLEKVRKEKIWDEIVEKNKDLNKRRKK